MLVDVEEVDPAATPTPSPTPSPSPSPEQTEDAAARALAESSLATADDGERWDPPVLRWLTVLAGALVGIALLWWLFLEVRIQDRLR